MGKFKTTGSDSTDHVHSLTTNDRLGGVNPFTGDYVDSNCSMVTHNGVTMHPLPRELYAGLPDSFSFAEIVGG